MSRKQTRVRIAKNIKDDIFKILKKTQTLHQTEPKIKISAKTHIMWPQMKNIRKQNIVIIEKY